MNFDSPVLFWGKDVYLGHASHTIKTDFKSFNIDGFNVSQTASLYIRHELFYKSLKSMNGPRSKLK